MDKEQITSFREEYFFLSNFYPCKITFRGLTFDNAEAAFQAEKSTDPKVREQFVGLSPKEAKRLGRKIKLRPYWNEIRVCAMQEVIKQKFRENEDLRKLLIETADKELIEGNTWNDRFWGVCKGKGKNMLGKILMDARYYFTSPIGIFLESTRSYFEPDNTIFEKFYYDTYNGGNEDEES